MNAALPPTAVTVTLAEIAKALGNSKQAVAKRAEKESWPFEEVAVRGGKQRLYPLSTLPALVAQAVERQRDAQRAVTHPSAAQQIMAHCFSALDRLKAADEAAEQAKAARGEAQLRVLNGGLSAHEALSLTGHCAIAQGWQVWFAKAQPIKKTNSWAPYTNAYNGAEIPVSKAVREAFPKISERSVQRWVSDYEKGNFEALVDRRNGSDKKGKTLFSATPLLAAYATKIMLERPGIGTEQLCQLLSSACVDAVTGEVLFTAPSYHQVMRFQRAWQKDHHDLYLQATNPDAFKNSVTLAFGSLSENVTALNQVWEMDATPADWLLIDEDGKKRRYTVSVILNVWCRRALVVVAKTPKAQTHCSALRLALLQWGVPATVVTDNGKDYVGEHFTRVLHLLGIEHKRTHPYSPEEKGHVERFNGTLNHSILELLPNFAGHSVAERKAIEARRSFAERLARKGELVDFADVLDGSCSGETLQKHINTWLAGVYEQRAHGALKQSPFARAASWTGETRRIRDERSLDILLARPAGGGKRILQKKGIHLDGTHFISPELARLEMGSEVEVFETPDLGVIVVYYRKNFLCLAQAPERTGVSRIEIAKAADAVQKERLSAARQKFKAETKGVPETGAVVQRYLNDKAAAAGKLVVAGFGKAKPHTSHGLEQAGKAAQAMRAPQPSSRAEELSAIAAKALAGAPANVVAPSAFHAHATPLEGMTLAERYQHWRELDALVKAHGGDIEVLAEAWQRRFWLKFPNSSHFRAQASMAGAQKEAVVRG